MTPRQAQQAAADLVQQLVDARESRDLRVVELAEAAGFQTVVLSHTEDGTNSPRLTTIIRWAEALDLEVFLAKRVQVLGKVR